MNSTVLLTGWRMMLFVAGIVMLFTILFVRLIDVQLIRGSMFRDWAESNRVFSFETPLKRGVFLDRYSDVVSQTIPVYVVYDDPARLFSASHQVSEKEVLQYIATNSAQVGYIPQREYPYGEALAHALGYTGPITAEDQKAFQELLPQDTIGKTGLEKFFDLQLRGTHGSIAYEIDALGNKQKQLEERLGKTGFSFQTSLDPYVSSKAYELLAGRKGAVVVTDARSGEVLALVSSPAFDPNVVSKTYVDPELEQARKASVSAALQHPDNYFFNRAVQGAYPPGSIFKIVTAAAGLETDSFSATTTVEDTGILEVGEYSYANWYYTQYGRTEGTVDLVRALARSNDIYFYKAAEWIGPFALAEFARLFGFGSPTGIELPSEAVGLVPDPAWKEETFGERWFLGNTYHYGIGQGDMLVTPLQVAQMMQTIGNYGMKCHPTLLHRDTTQCEGLGLHEEHMNSVLEGMIQACSPGGTAFPFFQYNAKMLETLPNNLQAHEKVGAGAVACKTGTAEFGANNAQGYRNTHAWFTMIIGTESFFSDETVGAAADEAQNDAPASGSATRNVTDRSASSSLYALWREKVEETQFPDFITITVLIESDEAVPFREGSSDAAPVAKALVDWMSGATGE